MNNRILIVDDHPELRKLVRMTLEYENYELHEARDGPSALEAIETVRPALLILDVMMPGPLDGYALCERIKRDDATSNITVILLTARGQEADLAHGRAVGADGYLVKPFSPLQLIDTVAEAMGRTDRAA